MGLSFFITFLKFIICDIFSQIQFGYNFIDKKCEVLDPRNVIAGGIFMMFCCGVWIAKFFMKNWNNAQREETNRVVSLCLVEDSIYIHNKKNT
jgi:uncharacterized membrane protein